MRWLTLTIPVLLASSLITLVLASQGGARWAGSVSCSSTTSPRDAFGRAIDLTGTWTGDDRQQYVLRQIGSCLWWASRTRPNVFYGTVYGSTVTGVWADLTDRSPGTSGTLTLLIRSRNELQRRSAVGTFPARSWKRP
jgi:hypothetical protein